MMARLGSTLIAALLLAGTLAAAPRPALVVIVNPARSDQVTLEELSSIYLKRRKFWPDSQPVLPLNLPAGSAAREAFSRRVLGRDSEQLGSYWNQEYFHGVFPPATLSSSAAVKRYVAADRNAIGYIEAGEEDDSVRVVLRLP